MELNYHNSISTHQTNKKWCNMRRVTRELSSRAIKTCVNFTVKRDLEQNVGLSDDEKDVKKKRKRIVTIS
jgi:hypothetical protein